MLRIDTGGCSVIRTTLVFISLLICTHPSTSNFLFSINGKIESADSTADSATNPLQIGLWVWAITKPDKNVFYLFLILSRCLRFLIQVVIDL